MYIIFQLEELVVIKVDIVVVTSCQLQEVRTSWTFLINRHLRFTEKFSVKFQ